MTDELKREMRTYRIVDASYRVHTRLYKLHHALYHTEKTAYTLLKNGIITTGAVIAIAISSFTLLFVQLLDLKLNYENYGTILIVIILLEIVYYYRYTQAQKAENELGIISSEIIDEHLEKWPDFLYDEATKWATRILMAKEVLDANEKIAIDSRNKLYEIVKNNYTNVIDDSIAKLKKIKTECNNLDCDNAIRIKIEKICNDYIDFWENIK